MEKEQQDIVVPNCLNCAWREVCQKRFGQAPDYAKHCVEYTYDVRLRNRDKEEESPYGEKSNS